MGVPGFFLDSRLYNQAKPFPPVCGNLILDLKVLPNLAFIDCTQCNRDSTLSMCYPIELVLLLHDVEYH